jgi:asparagine synthase (glutamine-hydrolysing)
VCGIAGEVHADPEARPDLGLVARMCRSIRYRGPDDQGLHADGPAALGAVRLAVIDLDTGHQPISGEDGSVTVVLNGEIYNFQELRPDLERRGHRFKTRSDTEVIVHLYEEYGEAFVNRLRGMFAIAVWDAKRRALMLVRDRLGVKPLFYRVEPRRLRFGSEIKTLLQDPSLPRVADLAGVDQMFRYGYTVPPTTCFQGIAELPPASWLRYAEGRVEVRRYWDLEFQERPDYREEQALGTLRELLREAVRLRLISDVPLGALLSGGIDSALVVAVMSELCDEPVRTFSIGFEDPSFSELPYARQVAERFGTEHHELFVTPDVVGLLPALIRHHDAPFYDSSAIPTWHVCRMAREHVTVALSGDGGDELCAGYNLYLADKAAGWYGRLPAWLRHGIVGPLGALVPETATYVNRGRVAKEFLRAAALAQEDRYERWTSKVKLETRRALYREPGLARLVEARSPHLSALFRAAGAAGPLNRLLYVDIHTELPNDVLAKVDRMSMANSLEVRSPLLDHRLHEFAATLPDRAKLSRWTTKHLLRRLAREYLPRDLLERPKRGFRVPLDRWFREPLSGFARDVLFDARTRSRGLFDAAAVERLVEDHVAARANHGREIWMLLVTELWYRLCIDEFELAAESPGPEGPRA